MAEAALISIAKSALQLFTSLAKDEFLLLWNSPEELERLELTIQTIGDLLHDADKMQSKEHSVQNCLSRLRNIMYDVDDLFDGLAATVLCKKTMASNAITKEVRLFFSKSNQFGVLVKVAHEVKSLKVSLDHIKIDMGMCGFVRQQPRVAQPFMRVNRNKTQSLVHEEDVIGRDQERTRIIKTLLPKDKGETSYDRSLCVVALIGFGGLGKTTLAQYVYNDEGVKQGFDECLWACINDLSNSEQVLIEIIASKEGRKPNRGLEMLKEDFRRIIGGKKFLLLLDDVWDVDSGNWHELEPILRCGRNGSKVLVTTRSTEVADCLDVSVSYRVHLDVLSEESAWSLFVKMAFHMGELSEHPKLEPLGKKIVHKCGNVPLAIITIGSLLRPKEKDEKIWSDFLDNQLKGVLSKSDDIKKVLMVSYNDLDQNLKLCFAYCSLFPKDYTFDKDELVRLWLSQGFIKPCDDSEQSLEEVGEEYFFYLVERCFFQEVEEYERRHPYDEIFSSGQYGHTAKMHDLLHDLAIGVAKSVFLGKVSTVDGKRRSLRHISIDYKVGDSFDYCSLVSHPKTVRTFLFQKGAQLNKSSLDMLLTSFQMLRTLCLPDLGIDHISECIGELIHLRYLNLSGNRDLKHLPKSICKVRHLMFFILSGCFCLEKLPLKIEKLINLRQLCIEGCDSLDSMPPGLKALTSLMNLDRLIVHHHNGGLGYLSELDNLCGSLKIELPEMGWADAIADAKNSNMSKKHKLSEMVIEWKINYPLAKNMGKDEARAVMEALEPHGSLEHLNIINYSGEMLPGWLCTLKNVRELCLSGCDQVEYIEDEIKDNLCFPSLETFKVEGMRNLKGWWRQEAVEETQRPRLPQVSVFSIHNCPELKGQMPLMEGIESLELRVVDVKLVKELLLVNPTLSSLHLSSIEGLISLQEGWIRHLTALQNLKTMFCRDLRLVSGRGLAHLTALTHLKVYSGEVGDEDEMGNEEVGMPWKALHGLEHLVVEVGNKHLVVGLEYLTRLENLVVHKWIKEDGVELQLKGLQNLRILKTGFDGKTCDLHKAGIQYLHSLRRLNISNCKELYLGWKTLVSMKLEWLALCSVERVIDVEDNMMMTVGEQQSLLRELDISGEVGEWVDDIPWTSLNSSLQRLTLDGMGEREQLPDGIQHLTSLRELRISRCEKVRSLPNWIPQLTSLTDLTIEECSEEVERRCERERGEDWPLIRHLRCPNIRTKRDYSFGWGEAVNKWSGEEEGSGKMGWCGGLTLSKFAPKFH